MIANDLFFLDSRGEGGGGDEQRRPVADDLAPVGAGATTGGATGPTAVEDSDIPF